MLRCSYGFANIFCAGRDAPPFSRRRVVGSGEEKGRMTSIPCSRCITSNMNDGVNRRVRGARATRHSLKNEFVQIVQNTEPLSKAVVTDSGSVDIGSQKVSTTKYRWFSG